MDTGEKKWALSLADQAIEQDPEYSFAYWQRTCAKTDAHMHEEALDDIETALNLSETLRQELLEEKYFYVLRENQRFVELCEKKMK